MSNYKNDYKNLTTKTLILCFSSGQTSAKMVKMILDHLECKPAMRNGIACHVNKYNRYVFVVFNNVGREKEESLQFVKDCDDNWGFRTIWLEAVVDQRKNYGPKPKIVNFKTACRNGDVFEAFIKKHGLPQPGTRKCTEVLKTQNTNAFVKQQNLGRVYQIVGIRKDEPHRHNWEKAKKNRLIWPLTTIWPTTKFEIIHFFNHNQFRLMLKSYQGNCKDCHLKTTRKLMTIALETPNEVQWSKSMEEKYAYHIPVGHISTKIKLPRTMYRGYIGMEDIIEMANTEKFELAIDETDLKAVYSDGNYYYDEHEECGESCDAF